MSGKTAFRNLFLLLLIVLMAAFAFNAIRDVIVKNSIAFEKAKSSVLYDTIPAEGMTIYGETLYSAAYDGEFEAAVEEWADVNSGQTVGVLTAAATDMESEEIVIDMTATHAGIVSFSFDGLEGVVTPGNLEQMELARLDEFYRSYALATTKTIAAGSPVFKVIEVKGEPRFYLRVDKTAFGEIPTGSLSLRFSDEDVVAATILQGEVLDDVYVLILKLPTMNRDFYLERQRTLDVVVETYKGIVVDTASLVEKDGAKGVYTAKNGIAVFAPVEVIETVGEQVVVEGLEEGTYFISNPSHIQEGQILQ